MSGPRPPVAVDEVIAGRALVDGRVITNPAARVRADAAVRLLRAARLRGDIKLSYALDVLDIDVDGSVCVDAARAPEVSLRHCSIEAQPVFMQSTSGRGSSSVCSARTRVLSISKVAISARSALMTSPMWSTS